MTQKPQTHCGDLAHLPAALLPLTAERRWVVWPWELRKSKRGKAKWTKPPRQARDPSLQRGSNDPSTWGTYDDAVAAVQRGNADGIGYMLLGRQRRRRRPRPRRRARHRQAASAGPKQLSAEANGAYRRSTVSGGGLRIIGIASGPETHRKFTFDRKTGAGIELYRNTARYITCQRSRDRPAAPSCRRSTTLSTRCWRGTATARRSALDFNDAGRQRVLDYDDADPERRAGRRAQRAVPGGRLAPRRPRAGRPSRSPTSWRAIPTASAPNTPTGCTPR